MSSALPYARNDVQKHERLIYQLRHTDDGRDKRLATFLESCSDKQRCRCGACILCGRRHQRAVFELIEREVRELARRHCPGRMTMVTIDPLWGCLAFQDLGAELAGKS